MYLLFYDEISFFSRLNFRILVSDSNYFFVIACAWNAWGVFLGICFRIQRPRNLKTLTTVNTWTSYQMLARYRIIVIFQWLYMFILLLIILKLLLRSLVYSLDFSERYISFLRLYGNNLIGFRMLEALHWLLVFWVQLTPGIYINGLSLLENLVPLLLLVLFWAFIVQSKLKLKVWIKFFERSKNCTMVIKFTLFFSLRWRITFYNCLIP